MRSRDLLTGALTVTLGLVGIDFAHALKEFFDVWFVDLGRARAFPAAAGCGTCGPGFL